VTTLPAIEPVVPDDRAAMDGWFDLLTAARTHDMPELPPACPLSHAARFSWPGALVRARAVRDAGKTVAVAPGFRR
jgi:hypothetical protein